MLTRGSGAAKGNLSSLLAALRLASASPREDQVFDHILQQRQQSSGFASTSGRQTEETLLYHKLLPSHTQLLRGSSTPSPISQPSAPPRRPFTGSACLHATGARPAKAALSKVRRVGPSGHKQRTSALPPKEPPDVGSSRFRDTSQGRQQAFEQMLARDTGAISQETRQLVTSKGKNMYQQPQNKPAAPWTPTRLLQKRKVLTKRMGFLIQELEKEKEAEAMRQKDHPNFGPGSVLELTLAVPENKGKPATVKGLCIARRNRGYRTTFTLLNHLGTFGQVERIFPLYSPSIKAIKVYEHRHVRRAKLYYLRDRNPREYRVN